jgi:hypothetical protein
MWFAWLLSFHLSVYFLRFGDMNVLYMRFLYSLRVLSMADFQVQQFYWLLRFFANDAIYVYCRRIVSMTCF